MNGQSVKYERVTDMNLLETISLLNRKMNAELNARLMEIGLTSSKSRLLKHLYNNGEMTQVDLCKELELDKSTVAKALARMEMYGLVAKRTNPDDTRSFLVYPTSKAAEIVPKTREVFSGWAKDVTACMTEAEKELFYELLHKVARQAAMLSNSSRPLKHPKQANID